MPVLASIDPAAVVLSAAAAITILRFKLGMLPVLGASCVTGVLLKVAGLI